MLRVTCIKLKPGVSFVQFGRTFGGNLRFTDDPTPGSPGSPVRNVTATARPDLSGVLMETTLINKHSGKPYNPYVIPFESIDGFEVDPESLAPSPEPVVEKEEPADPAEPPTPEKRKPGRPPKLAGPALALLLALFGAPSYASDASTERSVGNVLEKVMCKDAPWPGCVTCAHTETKQFQVVCDLPRKKQAKKGK